MSYRLIYTRRAIKDIDRLDAKVKRRIGNTLLRYIGDPILFAETLTDSELGSYRFRIGDYRVIFDIEEKDIVLLRVVHRKEIYKRK